MKKRKKNEFFDINKIPAEEGILVFPISMSRISNVQTAKKCWTYMKIFSPKKVIKPLIGLNFIYGDYLYFNSEEKANKLKNKFLPLILSHKNEFMKIVKTNPFYIQKAFHFSTWNQIILECKDFISYFGKLKKIYSKDKKFQEYLKQDFKDLGRGKLDDNQINFFLEETLLFYLVAKGKIKLSNEYVNGHEKWVLWCYPGNPLRTQIYLFQNNFFNLKNTKNKYENCCYNLEAKKLYDFDNVELETIKL